MIQTPDDLSRICPICQSRFDPREPGRDPRDPFCSDRCRMADLAHWFEGSYRIPGKPPEERDSELED